MSSACWWTGSSTARHTPSQPPRAGARTPPKLTEYLIDMLAVRDARTPAELADRAARLKPPVGPVTELRGVRWQTACFLLFCAIIREVFTNRLTRSGLGERLESLAVARAQLAVDPQLAWRLLRSIREARV